MRATWPLAFTFLILWGWQPVFAAASGHPCLLVRKTDLPRLRAFAREEKPCALGFIPAESWKQIEAKARRFLDAKPYSYTVQIPRSGSNPGERWTYTLSSVPPPRHDKTRYYPPWTAMLQERYDSITTRIKYLSAAYLITGDRAYAERAKKIVLCLTQWPQWTDPSYGAGRPCLDTGHCTQIVGLFYDWCHDDLNEAEQKEIHDALVTKGIVPMIEQLPHVPVYHNYWAVLTAGIGIGALVLLGEDPRAERTYRTYA